MRSTPSPSLRRAPLLLLVAAASCAPLPRGEAGPGPARLGDAEITTIAELLRLEDRREFDEATIRGAAAAAHPEVRRRAALALGRLRAAPGLPLLVHLLADPDTSVAATAAFAIGQLGDTAAVPSLVPWLDAGAAARAPTVAAEAASALGTLRVAAAAARLRQLLETASLARGRNPLIEHALLAVWRHPRDGDPAPILRWTGAPHPELRWRAAYALVRRPDPAATPHLLTLAADPDPLVRSFAVRGLTAPLADSAGLQRAAVLPVLLRAVDDADPAVAVGAIRTLGTYPDPSSVQRLAAFLDAVPTRAVPAAESLGRLGGEAAVAADGLRSTALDPARPLGVRLAALGALVQVVPPTGEAVARQLAQAPEWRLRAAGGRALAAVDPRPSPALAALIRDPDPRVGAATLQAAADAARENPAPLRSLLLESVGAADVQMRTAALVGLGRLADPSTVPLLLDALERAQRDTLNDAALAALDALGALRERGIPVGQAALRRIPRPADYLIHQRAIARLGEPARAAWGDPFPIETGRTREEYHALVRRWIVPALAGEPLPRARIQTASGTIDLRLHALDAPLTVDSFLRLADAGYFDGQEWPRVVANFVIQGGDPRGDQTGGPGYAIRDELNRYRYGRGTLGMALSGPDTGGSQFFITHSPQPHLDGGYTVFGEVVAGMEVVDRVVVAERIAGIRRLR